MASTRAGLRFFHNARPAFRDATPAFRRFGVQGRRFQSSEAGQAAQPQSWGQMFKDYLAGPTGWKTVHFW